MLDEVAVVADGERRVYDRAEAPGIIAGAALEGGRLVVEVSVELAGTGARPGSVVGIGVETPELDRDALRAQVRERVSGRGGQAGRRGGAGRGGRGRDRPAPPEPVEAWVRVTLAE